MSTVSFQVTALDDGSLALDLLITDSEVLRFAVGEVTEILTAIATIRNSVDELDASLRAWQAASSE